MKHFFLLLLITASIHSFGQMGEWTWMKGNIVPNSAGIFGTKGISSPANTPPALYGAALWVDASNNIWLFGGVSYNTLWKYDMITNEWTWINGTTFNSSPGVYGTMGIPSSTNTPGARGFGFLTWKDPNGDFWMYGGYGYDANGNEGLLNDLWKYAVSTNEWTWMQGSNSAFPSSSPAYGTFQVPSANNTPGGREETTVSWMDAAGNLWLFGGFDNNISTKDDVWKYDIALNQWAWMAGSEVGYPTTVYGTQGVPSPLNTPGGRNAYSSWSDAPGNLWLYGGSMLAGATADLWKFDITSYEWTWIGGSNVVNAPGVTGSKCIADTSFYPASRSENRACWTDKCGNFWMFGGGNYYNDLWAYRPNSNDWTYASGTLNANANGSYGVQGVSNVSNLPPGRFGAPAIYDGSGNAWVFGGKLPDNDVLNDLWRFVPDTICPASPDCIANQVPSFNASATEVCEKFCIDFTDQSSNNPTAWLWLFSGGVPASSTNQNPSGICYQLPGEYDVTLITTNVNGNDTLTISNYVTVNATPPFPTITQNGFVLTSSPAFSYQWQLNANDIAGAINQSYTVLQSGLYTVIAGDSNGCKNSATINVLISGIQEMNEAAISIYPNPSNGNFIVEWMNDVMTGDFSVAVVNTLGQVIFSSAESPFAGTSHFKKEIDLRDVATGIYFIEIKMKNGFADQHFQEVRKKVLIIK